MNVRTKARIIKLLSSEFELLPGFVRFATLIIQPPEEITPLKSHNCTLVLTADNVNNKHEERILTHIPVTGCEVDEEALVVEQSGIVRPEGAEQRFN